MFRVPIILVDDNQDYLDQLNRAFALSGLSCLPILYERNNPNNETGIDHVISDTKHARIIVLDINLRESLDTQNAKNLYPTIEKVLEKLNPIGPYYLIFWSRYNNLPEQIITLLSARSKNVIMAPIGWGYLDKTEFQNENNPGELRDKLLERIDDVCIFRLLLEWEDRTNHAASHTLSDLYKIAATPSDNGWKMEETKKKLITLVTHIAHESVGHKNSKDSANHAVETGLLPILEDNLLGMTSDEDSDSLNEKWGKCLEKLGDTRTIDALSKEDISGLNTFYNLEEVPEGYPKCKRGVFVTLSGGVVDDQNSFDSLFGKDNTCKKLVTEEFLFNTNVRDKKFRKEARKKIILGWLEVGAACDHAQHKNRLHRYLFSALVPSKYLEMVCDNSKSKMSLKAHDGIYRSPLFQYKKEQYVLLASFRYTSGLHSDSYVLDKPIFRLKEQIINEIAFAWSKHSIRPGITSFR